MQYAHHIRLKIILVAALTLFAFAAGHASAGVQRTGSCQINPYLPSQSSCAASTAQAQTVNAPRKTKRRAKAHAKSAKAHCRNPYTHTAIRCR